MNDFAIRVPKLVVSHTVTCPIEFKRGIVTVCPPMEQAAKSILNEMALGIQTKYRIAEKIEHRFLLANLRMVEDER